MSVLDIRFITPQISPGCPGNVIYIYIDDDAIMYYAVCIFVHECMVLHLIVTVVWNFKGDKMVGEIV